MLSVARSKLTLPVQLLFHTANGLGVFTSIVYDARTPDLYPNNSHHKLGWAVTWIAGAWTFMALVNLYTARSVKFPEATYQPVTSQAMAQHQQLQDFRLPRHDYSWSRDSGQGESLRSDSRSPSQDSLHQKPEEPFEPQQPHGEDHEDDVNSDEQEKRGFLHGTSVDRFLSRSVPRFAVGRTLTMLNIFHTILERSILVLGYTAVLTGIVVYSGIMHSKSGLLNGLAHWIKGSIFVWYGLLTLGRWMGAFQDYGWAWNVKPPHPLVSRFASRMPSAEFVESFVIWLYGASNVWLEHLTAWGQAWTATDIEHLSITFMFFGGGLLGMLIESSKTRDMLNTSILMKKEDSVRFGGRMEQQREEWELPKTYKTSLNPLPGLVILLLGLMMSAHHQDSMVSTMLHGQWGSLFVGFALARAVTYIMHYLSPPTSHFPSRPPSELVSSFCLIAGGFIFMGSSKDPVSRLERNHLDAMFVFTITMGATAALMAWTVATFAIKGWAARRESRTAGGPILS